MDVQLSANHSRRMSFLSLPKDQKAIYDTIGYREKLDAVDEGIRRYGLPTLHSQGLEQEELSFGGCRNAEFIDEMIADPVFADMLSDPDSSSHEHPPQGHTHTHDGPSHNHAHSHSSHSHSSAGEKAKPTRQETDHSQDKVRSTLRSFVRDWSLEGAAEREACYAPCLQALERHYDGKGKKREEVQVLVPGCGLGRLAMEIAARGEELSALDNDWLIPGAEGLGLTRSRIRESRQRVFRVHVAGFALYPQPVSSFSL